MTNYIVSITARGQNHGPEMAGTVNMPEHGVRIAFHSFAELRAILLATCAPKRPEVDTTIYREARGH